MFMQLMQLAGVEAEGIPGGDAEDIVLVGSAGEAVKKHKQAKQVRQRKQKCGPSTAIGDDLVLVHAILDTDC